MAENKVRKGFFFYVLMFLLLIIGFVGVCVVIMLFNPGKDVLGFCYYKNNVEAKVEKTTDKNATSIDIKDTQYTKIEIDAGDADVVLQNNKDYETSGIYIVNKSKGFIRTSDIADMKYEVSVSDSVLKINTNVKFGFVNISKDAKIIIHLGCIDDEKIKDTNLVIKTDAGSVNIGGSSQVGKTKDIYPKSVDIETGSGNITFTENASNSYTTFKVKTESGRIDLSAIKDKVNEGDNKNDALTVTDGDAIIDAGSGNINIDKVKDNVTVISKSGRINIKEVEGNLNVSAEACILDIDKVGGNVTFAEGCEIMKNCKVYIDEITGYLSVPQGRDSYFEIKKLGGDCNVNLTSGSIVIGSLEKENGLYCNIASGMTFIETTTGNINVCLSGANKARSFKTESGNITVSSPNLFVDPDKTEDDSIKTKDNTIETNSGDITINFNKDSTICFNFELRDKESDEDKFDLSNVSFDIFGSHNLAVNPYTYNAADEKTPANMKIITNSKVVLDLI